MKFQVHYKGQRLTPSLCCTTEAMFWRFWKFAAVTDPNSITSSPTWSPCRIVGDDQNLNNTPNIKRGNVRWCQSYSRLHWRGSPGSQRPPVQTEAEDLSGAPSPPPELRSHPFPSWLSHWHAACARPAQSPPWSPYDHSGDLRDKTKLIFYWRSPLHAMSVNILTADCTNPCCILLSVYLIIKITILVFCKQYNATTSIKN